MAELIKEETFSMKEEILPTSTEENVCTVYVQEDVVKKKEFEIKEEISPSNVGYMYFVCKGRRCQDRKYRRSR